MPFWQLYYHLVWATRNREPFIGSALEPELHSYLRGKGIELGAIVHAVGGMPDHVHVVASIPPRLAIAKFVGQLKGASSHWVNHLSVHLGPFGWQEGYGVLSFGKSALPQVVEYVRTQRERHGTDRLTLAMERIDTGDADP